MKNSAGFRLLHRLMILYMTSSRYMVHVIVIFWLDCSHFRKHVEYAANSVSPNVKQYRPFKTHQTIVSSFHYIVG